MRTATARIEIVNIFRGVALERYVEGTDCMERGKKL